MFSSTFEMAAKLVKELTKEPSSAEMLKLYGLYKQAKQDSPFEKATRPGMMDFVGKKKLAAWEKVSELSPEEAQKQYILLVRELRQKQEMPDVPEFEEVAAESETDS